MTGMEGGGGNVVFMRRLTRLQTQREKLFSVLDALALQYGVQKKEEEEEEGERRSSRRPPQEEGLPGASGGEARQVRILLEILDPEIHVHGSDINPCGVE